MAKVYATPGVYIEEKSAFPNSAVPVATAVPAFIGYTEKAILNKKDITHVPTRISSLGEYLLYFGEGPTLNYQLDKDDDANKVYKLKIKNSKKRFYLFQCIKTFFANGGSDCYIVSIGGYKDGVKKADFDDEKPDTENGGTKLMGISALLKEPEPTMVVIPDLVSLDKTDFDSIQQLMLKHCGTDMRSRIAILDVYDGFKKRNRGAQDDVIEQFRNGVQANNLQWGAAYYPWVHTTITSAEEVSFTNIDPESNRNLIDILKGEVDKDVEAKILDDKRAEAIKKEIDKIAVNNAAAPVDGGATPPPVDGGATPPPAGGGATPPPVDGGATPPPVDGGATPPPVDGGATPPPVDGGATPPPAGGGATPPAAPEKTDNKTLHQTLLAVSPMYKSIMSSLREQINLLPPSAAMAGVYSMVDNNVGVFQSPANVSIGSVVRPAVNISNEEQEDLNIPLNGKAVNAIRTFPGKGVLVWGARTLDGNSQDWRYISVRRTVIFIEQSIKYATEPYVFQPNTAATWTNVKAMITNFLTNVWAQGALAGATAEDAFSVHIGLGETMTPVDILDGYMRITVKLAVTRPAEFIVITFQQQMQKS